MGRLFQSRTVSPPPSSRVVNRGRLIPQQHGSDDELHKNTTAPASPIRPRAASHDGFTTTTTLGSGVTTTTTAAGGGVETTPRRRCNSRDYPRSYSGQYGQTDDLLPLEIQRQSAPHALTFCSLYVTLLLMVHWMVVVCGLAVPSNEPTASWTVTHALHTTATIWYLHWCKGSIEDWSGEMNALTVWEQWEAAGVDTRAVREACMVAPCILCWVACHTADYKPVTLTMLNLALWAATMCPKMPFMNGVRLFGINVTAGIDDEKVARTKARRE